MDDNNNKKNENSDQNSSLQSEDNSKENSQSYRRFSHGFGGVLLITLSSFSPNANAGSAVFGPCGVHYT